MDNGIIVNSLNLQDIEFESYDTSPDFFHNLTNLDLSYSHLKHLSSKFTEKLENLEKLSLADGELAELAPNSFKQLKNLKYLNLERSQLKTIDVEVFRGASSLERINFNYNELKEIDYKKLVNVVPTLKLINIEYNLFSCEYLQEMHDYLTNYTSLRFAETDMETKFEAKYNFGIRCDMHYPSSNDRLYMYGGFLILIVAIVTAIVLSKNQIRNWWSKRSAYGTMRTDMSGTDFQTAENNSA